MPHAHINANTIMKQLLHHLDPRQIWVTLDRIDGEAPSYTLSRPAAMRRVFATLACVSVCLLIIHYMKYFSAFGGFLSLLSEWQDKPSRYWLTTLQETGFLRLLGYSWWTFWHFIGFIVLPFITIKYIMKQNIRDMGWRWGDTQQHWLGYVLLISPILFFIFLVSFRDDFLNHYPFYKLASRSWFDFIAWECLYLFQFVCLEFFFRGFMINALRPAIGANAVWVMCVPYLMIHFPKLWPEAMGAILFGLFLGILALRSRSIWGGVMVHAGIAVTMDISSLVRQDTLPVTWLPW